MKNVTIFICLFLVLILKPVHAQKARIFQAKVVHFDYSAVKGILYGVSPQGVVLLDKKAVSAMSANDIHTSIENNQLPTFTVPFSEIQQIKIKRRGAAGKGFGLGYLASFVTLQTIMTANALSSDKIGCDGSRQKASFGKAFVGASCAAPPGILVNGIAAFFGGGLGSLLGSIPVREITFDSRNPEDDAREKLKKYALVL